MVVAAAAMDREQMHKNLDRSTLGEQQASIGRQQLQLVVAVSFICCS
jgi:hypothetical protein